MNELLGSATVLLLLRHFVKVSLFTYKLNLSRQQEVAEYIFVRTCFLAVFWNNTHWIGQYRAIFHTCHVTQVFDPMLDLWIFVFTQTQWIPYVWVHNAKSLLLFLFWFGTIIDNCARAIFAAIALKSSKKVYMQLCNQLNTSPLLNLYIH